MRVHLGTDHAGLDFSEHLKTHLEAQGHEVVDHGPTSYEPLDDYPSFCIDAAVGVVNDQRAGVQALGLTVFGDIAHKMNNVVAVEIPDGVPGDEARAALLTDFGIEIGTSFGPLHGKVWRIGTMGYNARTDAVLTTLAALEQVLRRQGFRVPPGGGVDAALECYGSLR